MNKYIIPICNLISSEIKIKKISARSILDCQDKIIEYFSEKFDENFNDDYKEFVNKINEQYDYAIGDIIDIETL